MSNGFKSRPGNVTDDHSQPVQCAEVLGRVSIFRAIVDGATVLKVRHTLLGKLAADYVMSKALKGIAITDAGETILQTTTIEVAKDGQPDLRSQIPETRLIAFLVYPLQLLEKVLDTAVIVGYPGIARGVWRNRVLHDTPAGDVVCVRRARVTQTTDKALVLRAL